MNRQPPGFDQALRRLTQLLGQDFVNYALGLPDGITPEGEELSAAQKNAVQFLARRTQPGVDSDYGAMGQYLNAMDLSRNVPGAGTSIVNVLRQTTGGEIEDPEPTGDVFVDSLTALARDIWPVFLIRPPSEGRGALSMSPPGVHDHPAQTAAVSSFLADDRLAKLFPFPPQFDGPRDSGWARGAAYKSLIITNGHGGSLQLISLISGLIMNSVFRCLIAGKKLSLGALVPEIRAASEDLRRLADGETVNVPAIVGFAGVRLPDGSELKLPDGSLRPARTTDREFFFAGTNSPETVFVANFPVRIYSIKEHVFEENEDPLKDDFTKYLTRMVEANRSFAHTLDLVRLSLLLASPPEKPWLAREVARYIPDLLSHGGRQSWDPGFASLPGYELEVAQFDSVCEWNALVKSKHVPSLDIGMRRLLSASTLRTDPIDAFVDAVICWETLFGVQTETTFRVTASIAKLLEPSDITKRSDLYGELRQLYSKRSRLVHGGSEPRAEELAKHRQRAIDVATDCFRTLYRDRADLIELASDARGTTLLLE